MEESEPSETSRLEPTQWMKRGWLLVYHDWKESLSIGCLFALITYLCLSWALNLSVFFLLPALMLLTLIAPLFTFYCYQKAALNINFKTRCLVFCYYIKEHTLKGGLISCLLISLLFLWLQLEVILFVLLPESQMTTINMAPMITLGTLIGAFLSLMIFCLTAFSPQLLMKGGHHTIDALFMSLAVVKANPKPMFIWFALISLSMLLSLATLGIGFILFMPLMSYSSWYAFQDVFERADT